MILSQMTLSSHHWSARGNNNSMKAVRKQMKNGTSIIVKPKHTLFFSNWLEYSNHPHLRVFYLESISKKLRWIILTCSFLGILYMTRKFVGSHDKFLSIEGTHHHDDIWIQPMALRDLSRHTSSWTQAILWNQIHFSVTTFS